MMRNSIAVFAGVLVSVAACKADGPRPPVEVTPQTPAQPTPEAPLPAAPSPVASPTPVIAAETATAPHPGPAHHGHAAPVDCPLAAAGHDPANLRPFKEVADYIAFLERADRATWQRPDEVVTALALAEDAIVVDIGAGSGYFAFRFAAAVPRGAVEALDVEAEMVRHMHHRTMVENIANLRAAIIDGAAPVIRKDADVVFVCDVLHHVPDPVSWLGGVVAQMPAGARLALLEFAMGDIPEGPPESVRIPKSRLLEIAQGAGLELASDFREVTPYQEFLVFRKGAPTP